MTWTLPLRRFAEVPTYAECNNTHTLLRPAITTFSNQTPKAGIGAVAAKWRFVRIAALCACRSERPLSADSVEKQRVAGAESDDPN